LVIKSSLAVSDWRLRRASRAGCPGSCARDRLHSADLIRWPQNLSKQLALVDRARRRAFL
jgi:hypothetical protein